jgi:tRNA threonylcarbamoyladenosine biosynthesis protein TsaB
VQEFARAPLRAAGPLCNLSPQDAAAVTDAELVVGSGAGMLVDARGRGEALDRLPSARHALLLSGELADLEPRPVYARAPDAKPRAA